MWSYLMWEDLITSKYCVHFLWPQKGSWELAGQDTLPWGTNPVYSLEGLSVLTAIHTSGKNPTHPPCIHPATSTGPVVSICSEENWGWAEGGLPQVGLMYIDNNFREARIACACRMLGSSQWSSMFWVLSWAPASLVQRARSCTCSAVVSMHSRLWQAAALTLLVVFN